MARAAEQHPRRELRGYAEARVRLLIATHALPSLSYKVPENLRPAVGPGSVVVAPLGGRSRLGVVVGSEGEPDRAREEILSVVDGLSIPRDLLAACVRLSASFAVPLPVVLRAALPPGLDTGRYRVVRPDAGWPWDPGTFVSRATLKAALGAEALREAEAGGRVLLAPALPARGTTEWAVVRPAAEPDLGRARRQREVLRAVRDRGGEAPVPEILSATGAGREILRALVRRGALRIVPRPRPAPIIRAEEDGAVPTVSVLHEASRALDEGGPYVWRVPSREQPGAVSAAVRAALDDGRQALVVAPEIGTVDRLVEHLRRALPAGYTVAAYHSGVGRDRAAVHEAARRGEVGAVVGTRAAVLLPLVRPGVLCLVDEPDGAHRAAPGYEGLPVHARDILLARGGAENAAVVLLSPAPSLRLYAPEARGESGIRELTPRLPERWPAVRIVDMRGSGAPLSSALVASCRGIAEGGGRVGVISDRLGYATAVSCNNCGAVTRCADCDLPLALHDRTGTMSCARCGRQEPVVPRCEACGSDRLMPTGLAVERVRELLSAALGGPVGLATAGLREREDAPVVVGTARRILEGEWEAVVLPDVDAALQGSAVGATERSFRLIYRAAEAARGLLILQTRLPGHGALRAAAAGDYDALVAAEVPRLRAAGYPPFAHLAAITLTGPRSAVADAVESRLRPDLTPGVAMSDVARAGRPGGAPEWKVLLRSRERRSVGRAAARAARIFAGDRKLTARVEVDPEEV